MLWGEYLCCGASHEVPGICQDKLPIDSKKLISRLELALQHLGLSKFSSRIAVQFIAGKLESGSYEKLSHAVPYLLDLLNGRSSSSRSEPAIGSQEKCPQIIPGLHASPFWDTSKLPWVQQLESSFNDIKQEFLNLRERVVRNEASGFQHYLSPKAQTESTVENSPKIGESATDRGHWNVCYFYLHGVDFSENLERCPKTATAISSIPRQYHHALFSALAPDTHVKPHCGPTNKKLRCHLPLHIPPAGAGSAQHTTLRGDTCTIGTVPNSAWLRVGSEYRALEEGKCVVFDDSFEHEACNPSTTEPRIVLIIDVWHPDLSDEEVKFFEFINKAQIKAAQKIGDILKRSRDSHVTHINMGTQKDEFLAEEGEDFLQVIMAAKDMGISDFDFKHIWLS